MSDEDGKMVWVVEIDGEEVSYCRGPLFTWRQRFMSGFIGLFGVAPQL